MLESEISTLHLPTNSGFAKAILFGEHSVVYGYPAVVFGIGIGATTFVLPQKADSQSGTKFYFRGIDEDFEVALNDDSSIGHAFNELFNVLQIPSPLSLNVELSIPTGAGLGSSAAIGVSIARTLISHFELPLERMNPAVEAFERVFHSSPSGVDQAAATSGGIFAYNKQDGIEKIKNPELHVVIANVGSRAPTSEIVRDVALEKEKDETKFQKLLSEMGEVARAGISALASGDIIEVGRLMSKNHSLLKQMTVSSPDLNEACILATKKGSLGAKLTGAGRGGCMIALIEPDNIAVQKALSDAGYWTHTCHILASVDTMEH